MNEIKIIKDLEQRLEAISPLEQNRKNTLEKKFRLEFNYNTNHIEGNTITYSETELLLIFDDAKGNHSMRELEEMKGSDVAFQLVKDLAIDNERPLTEQNIKYLNEILLVRPFWKEAITPDGQNTRRLIKVGDYKEFPNSVRLQNGEIFEYTSPSDTPIQMAELIDWFRREEEKKELHPIQLAALLHYKFVRIHPFDDGNGRISRLLMNYVLFKNNLPPVIIKTELKKEYLAALNRADTGDIDYFVKHIAQQLIWSLEISIKAAMGESIDEPGDLAKKIKMLKQKMKIGNEKVSVTKSKEVMISTLNNSIEPMLLKVSDHLSEFSSMFKSSKENLISNVNGTNTSMGNTLVKSISALKTSISTSPNTYSKIKYQYTFNNFRTVEVSKAFVSSFEIVFHENLYEIIPLGDKPILSKLYDEPITDAEIENLVEFLGLKLVKEIEDVIEN